jgi:hypothetical protein
LEGKEKEKKISLEDAATAASAPTPLRPPQSTANTADSPEKQVIDTK